MLRSLDRHLHLVGCLLQQPAPCATGGDDPAPKPVIFSSQPVLFEIVEARGTYPEGSCLMAGPDRSYVLSPLSNIVDEAYTVGCAAVFIPRYARPAHRIQAVLCQPRLPVLLLCSRVLAGEPAVC